MPKIEGMPTEEEKMEEALRKRQAEVARTERERKPYKEFEAGILEWSQDGRPIAGFCGQDSQGRKTFPEGVNPADIEPYLLTGEDFKQIEEKQEKGEIPQFPEGIRLKWGWKNPPQEFLEEKAQWVPEFGPPEP